MTSRTYADLLSLTEGLCGVTFASIELPRIVSLMNRRAAKAYRASNHWPRFLRIGEERAVSGSVIPFTESTLDDIGVFLRIHRTEPFSSASAQEFSYMVTSSGAKIVDGSLSPTGAFVTYKKAFTPSYSSTSTDIPGEWFDYIAYGTYADFLRSEGQQEKAALADSESADILTDELLLIDEQGTMQIVANRVSTNLNMQTR